MQSMAPMPKHPERWVRLLGRCRGARAAHNHAVPASEVAPSGRCGDPEHAREGPSTVSASLSLCSASSP
jgi:hypothetical protein